MSAREIKRGDLDMFFASPGDSQQPPPQAKIKWSNHSDVK
jgi:hypothetical protein